MPRAKDPLLVGQRAAIFGLILAGQSLGTVSNILGYGPHRIRAELTADWIPPRYPQKPKAPKPPKRVPLDQSAVVAMFKGGHHTLQEVGNHFGVTRERVRQILSRNGVMERTHGALPREVQEDRLRRYQVALAPGVTSKEACAASGVSYPEAAAAAVALGFSLPRPIRKTRIAYQTIAAFYESHPDMTGVAVAHHFGVAIMTVSRAIRIMGVTPRHSGWSWRKRPEQTVSP